MIKLDKIYTRGGDKGKTSLGLGERVSKSNKIIIAIGSIEELNAHLGIACQGLEKKYAKIISDIQHDLFDLGADLAFTRKTNKKNLRITVEHTLRLENKIDEINNILSPLKSFVLPGGTIGSSRLHLARTVCRRCEINIINLSKVSKINGEIKKYINRLSDLLFVLARVINGKGKKEILWKPGKNIQT